MKITGLRKMIPGWIAFLSIVYCSCTNTTTPHSEKEKQTILLLGGTPSTIAVLNEIPDSLKEQYHFISFNRPGFGGTDTASMTKEKLYQLAKEAGLKENDYGIIAVSGGAPLALLLADHFHVQHCGIISGMVSREAYFEYADSTFTKDLFLLATGPFAAFKEAAMKFPNIDDIVAQAGARSAEEAIQASYNELNFILTPGLLSGIQNKAMPVDWWHGEKDKNCAIESVKLFLNDFPNAQLNVLADADHGVDARMYTAKIIDSWKE